MSVSSRLQANAKGKGLTANSCFPITGFLLGTRQTLLETFDGGKTWEPRSIEGAIDEGFNYRFNSISFNGSEGWIVGKPSIVLHTSNSGQSWERIPLSSKLPGWLVFSSLYMLFQSTLR